MITGRIFEIMMYFCPLKVLFLASSEDPDEMQHDAAFHLVLHCLPKYSFRGFQNTKGAKQCYIVMEHIFSTKHWTGSLFFK